MKGIRWIKSCPSWYFRKKIPNYNAKIGHIRLWCRPSTRHYDNGKFRILGWIGSVYFENKSVDFVIEGKSLEFVQKKAEKSAIKYLLGHGFITIKALKKVGLLEEMLSEVGIDV